MPSFKCHCGRTIRVKSSEIEQGHADFECKCGLGVRVEVTAVIHCPKQGTLEEPDTRCKTCDRPLCYGSGDCHPWAECKECPSLFQTRTDGHYCRKHHKP